MLCEKCGQREATVHITSIADGQITKSDLCHECGGDAAGLARLVSDSFREQIAEIVAQDQRYEIQAYEFVREALDEALVMSDSVQYGLPPRHISGKELLEVLRIFILLRFGKDAKRHLKEWGVKSCEDFGEIVFNLVDAGLLGKQPSGRREDFRGGYDFDKAFPER